MERTSERVLVKPVMVHTKLVSDPEEAVAMLDSDGDDSCGAKSKPRTPSSSVFDAWESFEDAVDMVKMKTVGTALNRFSRWMVAT